MFDGEDSTTARRHGAKGQARPGRRRWSAADKARIVAEARAPGAMVAAVGNHSFRATGITAYLRNGGTLERAAAMANHASTRTTQLYDRRSDEVTLDEVERIGV